MKIAFKSKVKRCPNGTLQQIIETTEKELFLPAPNTVKFETVVSRVKSCNVSGECHQKQSPLQLIEPLIVDWACRMSRMGQAFSKDDIIDLADEIISNTQYSADLIAFCKKRGVEKNEENLNERLVGNKWYRNFMNRHDKELKRGKCRIQDNKRRTCCTCSQSSQ